MKYRKKPVVIEAMHFNLETKDRVFNWITCNKVADWGEEDGEGNAEPVIRIETLEGDMIARPGDYIIKGIKGEFYPCKPDIFEATYEAVDDSANVKDQAPGLSRLPAQPCSGLEGSK